MDEQSNIEEWILDYCAYDELEKQQVEKFVEEHEQWEPVFQSARSWDALLASARNLVDPDYDEAHLPYAVVAGLGFWPRRARTLQQAVERVHRRVEKNESLFELRTRLKQRKNTLESESFVVEHFEKVTGHQIRAIGRREWDRRGVSNQVLSGGVASTGLVFARKLVRGFTLLAGVYMVLFAASTLRESPLERMAHLTTEDFTWTQLGVSTRGADPAWERIMLNRYEEALQLAQSSSLSFIGLFPIYRMDKLRRARTLLQRTIGNQAKRELVPSAAYLTLAKLHFLLGDRLRSIDALREALRLNSYSSDRYDMDLAEQFNEMF